MCSDEKKRMKTRPPIHDPQKLVEPADPSAPRCPEVEPGLGRTSPQGSRFSPRVFLFRLIRAAEWPRLILMLFRLLGMVAQLFSFSSRRSAQDPSVRRRFDACPNAAAGPAPGGPALAGAEPGGIRLERNIKGVGRFLHEPGRIRFRLAARAKKVEMWSD